MKLFLFGNIYFIKIYALVMVVIALYASSIETFSISPMYRGARFNFDPNNDFKYILQWSSAHYVPFTFMSIDQLRINNTKCAFSNCYITSYKALFNDYTKFDVISFSGPDVVQNDRSKLPRRRSWHQKYVFASMDSSDSYPVHSNAFDGFFNWTWTYKLNSDLRWGFIVVRDVDGKIIGPNKEMLWLERDQMLPVSDKLLKSLKTKKKAAAGFISNCLTQSKREQYISDLKYVLEKKYNLTLDIYGRCGTINKTTNEEEFQNLIKTDYYFFLAFEKSLSEDFVTDTLLRAVNYNTIPIVYGGANYTRFLPEGSYLNARSETTPVLAEKMHYLIQNFEEYILYFKWTNHYSYQSTIASEDTNEYCQMCALLNDEKKVTKVTVYDDFREWWNNYNYEDMSNKDLKITSLGLKVHRFSLQRNNSINSIIKKRLRKKPFPKKVPSKLNSNYIQSEKQDNFIDKCNNFASTIKSKIYDWINYVKTSIKA